MNSYTEFTECLHCKFWKYYQTIVVLCPNLWYLASLDTLFFAMFRNWPNLTLCFCLCSSIYTNQRGVFCQCSSFMKSDVVFLAMFRCFCHPTRCFCQCSSVFEIRRGDYGNVPMFKESDVVFFDNVPVFRESDVVFLAMFRCLENPTWCFWNSSSVCQIRHGVFDNVPVFKKIKE